MKEDPFEPSRKYPLLNKYTSLVPHFIIPRKFRDIELADVGTLCDAQTECFSAIEFQELITNLSKELHKFKREVLKSARKPR